MNDLNVEVGDRVVLCHTNTGYVRTGTVIKITEKRKDIVVDYGTYKATFSSDGWEKGSSSGFHCSYIKVLTPKIEEQLLQIITIKKCRDVFTNKRDLTFEQAEKILKILEAEEVTK